MKSLVRNSMKIGYTFSIQKAKSFEARFILDYKGRLWKIKCNLKMTANTRKFKGHLPNPFILPTHGFCRIKFCIF